MMSSEYSIEEKFELAGRGAVVVINESTGHIPGKPYPVEVRGPRGQVLKTIAFMEFILRSSPKPNEKEAYMLEHLHKEDIPEHSMLVFL